MSNIGRKIRREIARRNDKPRSGVPARREEDDPDDNDRSGSVTVSRAEMSYWSGPMPPAEEIAKYNMVYPQAAEIMFEGMREQGQHRRWLEKQALIGAQRRSWGGLVAALIIAIFTIGSGSFLINKGHDTAGATIITSTVVGLVLAFLSGQRQQKAELEKKREAANQVTQPRNREA